MFLFAYSFSMCLRAERYSGYGYNGDNYMYWELNTETGILYIYPRTNKPSGINGWTNYKTYIRSVVIAEGILQIGYNDFMGCSNLTSIYIPESVGEISNNAFENCTSLTSITIPEKVSKINTSTFIYCISAGLLPNLPISYKYFSVWLI